MTDNTVPETIECPGSREEILRAFTQRELRRGCKGRHPDDPGGPVVAGPDAANGAQLDNAGKDTQR